MTPRAGEKTGRSQSVNRRPHQTGHTVPPPTSWNHSPRPRVCRPNLREDVARLDQKGLSEGPRRPSLLPGMELAVLLKRTKNKEERARRKEPHGAASWGTDTHEPVGEVRGDQTAESRNENRLGPKGWQL